MHATWKWQSHGAAFVGNSAQWKHSLTRVRCFTFGNGCAFSIFQFLLNCLLSLGPLSTFSPFLGTRGLTDGGVLPRDDLSAGYGLQHVELEDQKLMGKMITWTIHVNEFIKLCESHSTHKVASVVDTNLKSKEEG